MSAITRSTKLPADLSAASHLRADALGYPSWNAYIVGLIRADIAEAVKHEIPFRVLSMKPLHRDRIDAEMLQRARAAAPPSAEVENLVEFIRRDPATTRASKLPRVKGGAK